MPENSLHISASDELTIGELAERSGVATSALRFYEERGLLKSMRTNAGHRRFRRAEMRRVAFIVFAQRIGLSLEEIREELSKLPERRIPSKSDWVQLSGKWRQRIDARIAELETLRDNLTGCIGCGCLSLKRCKLANPDDRMARRGEGPRFWMGDKRDS